MDPQADTQPPYHFGVGAVCALLDAMIRDTPRSRPEKADVLRTCRKWLTGLSPAKMFTAFADLDPRGLDDPRTRAGAVDGGAAASRCFTARSSAAIRRPRICSCSSAPGGSAG